MLLKRLLIAALIGLAAAALAVGVTDADRAERVQLQQAGTSIGTRFTIPVQPALSDPDLVLRVLQHAADTSQVNVLRTSWGYDTNDQPLTTHYAYIAADKSHLFDVLRLRDGRFPTAAETRTGTAFLASRPTGQPDPARHHSVAAGFLSRCASPRLSATRLGRSRLDRRPDPGGDTPERRFVGARRGRTPGAGEDSHLDRRSTELGTAEV